MFDPLTVSGWGKSLKVTASGMLAGTSTASAAGEAAVSWKGSQVPGRGRSPVVTLQPGAEPAAIAITVTSAKADWPTGRAMVVGTSREVGAMSALAWAAGLKRRVG